MHLAGGHGESKDNASIKPIGHRQNRLGGAVRMLKARICRAVVFLAIALSAVPGPGMATRLDVPRMVFAHYMVCCPRDGHEATVENLKAEIRTAQAHKIDGFALNLSEWFHESYYRDITRRMFSAAEVQALFFI
jgi:hypothetical protein